ncbi:M48 family metalloprotease [Planctobacterium marinum]|uniref:Putative beta-barrel assembly-enhancing protease n=1 Tax=Planctobacterium marinum TaxID=1631968 RepID=A0AA48KS13_9ALTE|nr:putative beta-barrel assembly-enhancing protease [Planctobacterium marinum]
MMKIYCFLLSFLFTTVAAQTSSDRNSLPEIGVVASDAISIAKEMEIGEIMMRQLRSQSPIISDPVLDEYINDIGNRLVVNAENVKFPFEFFLINNRDINAFAFFGGHVGVHTGLIYQADNESELASVLAHEISHVTQRHIARRIAAQSKAAPLALASMLGGILLAMVDPEAGVAAISASQAASSQFGINYTRSNEQEADRVGFDMLDRSGFDVSGAASFFGKLVEKSRGQSKQLAFLQTHPLPESRVSDARSRQAYYRSKNLAPNLSFHLVKARIQARYMYDPEYNIADFHAALKSTQGTIQRGKRYGLALSYLANEQPLMAEKTLEPLLKEEPENLFYIDLATDIALELKRYDIAINNLQNLSNKIPRNQVISLNLANALIKKGDYANATEVLSDYLLVDPDHALSYQLLIDALRNLRSFLQMHQAKAEYLVLLAAHPNAIDELHTAYNFAKDNNLEQQRIRARIEQLRQQEKRIKSL